MAEPALSKQPWFDCIIMRFFRVGRRRTSALTGLLGSIFRTEEPHWIWAQGGASRGELARYVETLPIPDGSRWVIEECSGEQAIAITPRAHAFDLYREYWEQRDEFHVELKKRAENAKAAKSEQSRTKSQAMV
jgi:hypothetical protein